MPDQEQIAQFFQKLLMVIGGFAAGYLFTWIAGVGFDKTVVKGKSPDFLHKWARIIGGVLVALVVAFFVFRGGKGNGDGTGGDGPGTGPTTNPTSPQTSQTPITQKQPEVAVDAVPVYVTVYAGKAVEPGTENFFALGDLPGPKTDLVGLVKALDARNSGQAKMVLVYTLDDTVNTATTSFLLLQRAAKDRDLTMMSRTEFDKLRRK